MGSLDGLQTGTFASPLQFPSWSWPVLSDVYDPAEADQHFPLEGFAHLGRSGPRPGPLVLISCRGDCLLSP